MPRPRISMKHIRDVLRYRHKDGCSKRQIATYLQLSPGTVRNYLRRAESAGLRWPLPSDLNDEALSALLFPPKVLPDRAQPNWPIIHKQLSQRGMTLERAWHEYRRVYPDGYSYGHFCVLYRQWSDQRNVTMRLHHKAGEKVFVDFAGTTVDVIDQVTGEVTHAQIFVGVLGCSNYLYVEALPDQKLRSWIGTHVRMFEFFGAVPQIVVCDNLKSAVTRPRGKNPKINETYLDFARHYDTKISPARPRKPQDKSLAESGVKFATNRILSALRTQDFFSIEELNKAIRPMLEDLNALPFQKKLDTRIRQFRELDFPAMGPLPAQPYEFKEFKKLIVNMDYHVQVNGCYYSVPYRLHRKKLDVTITDTLVKCRYKGNLVAIHQRLHTKGSFSTQPRHMPKNHRSYHDRERFLARARAIGPKTEALILEVLKRKEHQETSFRSATGILGLQAEYSPERLEAACGLALRMGMFAYNYPSIAGILRCGNDRLYESVSQPPPILHKNIRGGLYYTKKPPSNSCNIT